MRQLSHVYVPAMSIHARFWTKETPVRLRSWWRRHWWPARIRQLDRERLGWARWCRVAEAKAASGYYNPNHINLDVAAGYLSTLDIRLSEYHPETARYHLEAALREGRGTDRSVSGDFAANADG